MPITVNYNPDIELLGQVSYETGQGVAALRERQRQDQLRQIEQQRQDQFHAADIDRFDRYNFDYMNRAGSEQARAAQEYQQALARQQQQEQFAAEQERLGLDSQRRYKTDLLELEGRERQRQDEAGLRQQQRDYYIQSVEQKRQQQEAQEEQWRQEQALTLGGEWKLSDADEAQKQAELQQIQQYSQYLLPQEYEQVMQEHESRWRGKEKLVAPQKLPKDEVEGSTYVDERIPGKPIVWHKDKDGSWRPTPIETQQEGQDEAKINEAALRFAEKVDAQGGESPAELAAYTKWRFDYAKAVLLGQEPPPPLAEVGEGGIEQPPPTEQPPPEPEPELVAEVERLNALLDQAIAEGDDAQAKAIAQQILAITGG